MLKTFPAAGKGDARSSKAFQEIRLASTQLEKENEEMKRRMQEYSERYGETTSKLGESSSYTIESEGGWDFFFFIYVPS